jgi:signal transduction histidine kinase
MRARSRRVLAFAALTIFAVGAETSHLAASYHDAALGGGAWWEGVIQAGAAAGALVAGIVLVSRNVRATGVLLALTGPAILLAQLPASAVGTSFVFTAALIAGTVSPALAASAAITYPVAAVGRLERGLVSVAVATALVVQGLLPAMLFEPRATGCFSCARNLAAVRSDPSLHLTLIRTGLVLTVAWAGCIAARTVWRWLRAASIVRLINGPLVLGGAAIASLAAIAAAHSLGQTTTEIDSTLRACWLTQCGLVAVMCLGVLIGDMRARRLTGTVSASVIAAVPDPEELRSILAASINDDDLALVFPRHDSALIDVAGHEVPTTPRPFAALRVTRGENLMAEIRYDERLVGAAQQLAASVRAAGLAIEHVAARAQLLAELAELDSSRRRIIEAGDAERQRLERDLHDGAQQRLIALQMQLQTAGSAAAFEHRDGYAAARREVGIALEELRDLAHGIHPAVLSDAGLGVGLRMLAEGSRIPLAIEGPTLRRYAAAVETAAYRLVADTIRLAERQQAPTPALVVTLIDADDALRIRLIGTGLDPTEGTEIVGRARDRFMALSGSVWLEPAAALSSRAIAIEAVIPCG